MASQYPIFAKVSASSSGNNTIVAAATGYKIRVLHYFLVASGAVDVKFQSGASGTDITGLMQFDAKGQNAGSSFGKYGVMETASAELLNLNLSAAVNVGGHIVYTLVEA